MLGFLPDTMATIMPKPRKAQIIIPAKLCPWPHELRVAQIKALRQSPNIIIDSSRTNGKMIRDGQICDFLVSKVRQYRQIKRMIFVTRTGRIIDIKALVC